MPDGTFVPDPSLVLRMTLLENGQYIEGEMGDKGEKGKGTNI
jgi:hypothetical protein